MRHRDAKARRGAVRPEPSEQTVVASARRDGEAQVGDGHLEDDPGVIRERWHEAEVVAHGAPDAGGLEQRGERRELVERPH